jgi:hypothetical protein
MLVRAADATHVFAGIDLAFLSDAAKPSVVVTAEDLARIGTRVPEFYEGDLFCSVGKTPLYLGQPIALLIFETFDTFDRAQLELRGKNVLKFGAETGPVPGPTTVPIASPGSPARYPTLPIFMRRSRKAGSAPESAVVERPQFRARRSTPRSSAHCPQRWPRANCCACAWWRLR